MDRKNRIGPVVQWLRRYLDMVDIPGSNPGGPNFPRVGFSVTCFGFPKRKMRDKKVRITAL